MKRNIIIAVYNDIRTVFRLNDIALLVGETNFQSLNKKLNYYVRTGKLQNPRKGIYTKSKYNNEELACTIFTPSYISLEFVLQKEGIIFQYDSRITVVSYLSRTIEVENQNFIFRKVKGEILANPTGIIRQENHISIASVERAFLDMMYLSKDYYFDNVNLIKKQYVFKLLPLYQSKALAVRVNKLLKNG